jgi:hypothetical protein
MIIFFMWEITPYLMLVPYVCPREMKQVYIEVDENLQQKIRQQYIQTPGLAFYLGIIHGTPTNLHLDMITIDARFVIRRGYSLDFLIVSLSEWYMLGPSQSDQWTSESVQIYSFYISSLLDLILGSCCAGFSFEYIRVAMYVPFNAPNPPR